MNGSLNSHQAWAPLPDVTTIVGGTSRGMMLRASSTDLGRDFWL
jgi:hypothetical protein